MAAGLKILYNNATYAAYAESAAAQALAAVGWSPLQLKNQGSMIENRQFHIKYLTPALWGDVLNVTTYLAALKPTGGRWYIEIKRESDGEVIIHCLLDWALVNQINGKEQSLPERLLQTLNKRIIYTEKNNGVGSKG